jgi:AcrR family transcriptional regulator
MGRRRLTRRGSKRREQIEKTAIRLFAEQGYHGTTVGDICDDVGVGKGVFYWYYDSKQELFSKLLNDALFELRKSQQSAIQKMKDPKERIEEGIRASVEYFRSNPGILALIRTASRYEEFVDFVRKGEEIVVSDTASHIRDAMAMGEIRQGDAEFMAHGILGAIFHFVETYLGNHAHASQDRPELADEAVAFCLRGIMR